MLPRAVEEANRRAEELHRQMYGNTEQPAPEEEPKAEQAPESPQTAAEAPAEAPEVVAPTEAEEAGYKRQLEVLKGKYSAEVPRMAAEIRELKGKLAEALNALNAKESAPAPVRKIKPEEVQEYGENFVDFVQRAASEVVPQDVGEIKQTVEQLKGQTEQLNRARFFTDLARLAPKWESLNEDKGFLTWLSGMDPYSGRLRSEIFDEASGSFDAWRVANFFNGYPGSEQQQPAPDEPDQLAQQVEPPTTRVGSPPPSKRMWKTSEITSFYDGVRAGRFTQAEAERFERDIFAAQREGRIVQR